MTTPPPDAASAGKIEPLNPATHPLREEALVAWRDKYAKQSLISDAPPSWFKCFTQGYVAGHDSLAARLARAESALVEARVRAAMADQYLHKAKATHTNATDHPMYEVRDRAPGALDEMERLTWCAHDCLDMTSDTIKGSKVWIEEEAKARALLATPGEGEGA